MHKEEEEVDEETKREEVINGERPFLVKKEKKKIIGLIWVRNFDLIKILSKFFDHFDSSKFNPTFAISIRIMRFV